MKIFLSFLIILASIVTIYLAIKRVKNTDEQYLFAGRSITYFALIATLVMTEFNPTTLVSYSASGYSAGMRAILLPFALFICLVVYAMLVARKWKKYNGISVAHFLGDRFGKPVEVISTISLLFAMLLFSATYVKSLTLILSPLFFKTSSWIISFSLVALMIAISIFKGLQAIIRLDIFSFIVVCLFFPLMVFYCYDIPIKPVISQLTWSLPFQSLPTDFIISMIVLAILSYVSAPWYAQKIFSAKNQKIAYLSVLIAALFLFALYSLGVYATHLLRLKGIILSDSQAALPFIIHNVLPKWLRIITYVVVFLISATTIASAWNTMASIVAKKQSNVNTSNPAKKSLVCILLFAILSWFLSNSVVKNVFSVMWFANIPPVSLCFAVLAGFFWKKTSSFGAFLSILSGIISGYICYYLYGDQGDYMWRWLLEGIPIIFGTGILGSYLVPNRILINPVSMRNYERNH